MKMVRVFLNWATRNELEGKVRPAAREAKTRILVMPFYSREQTIEDEENANSGKKSGTRPLSVRITIRQNAYCTCTICVGYSVFHL